MVSAFRFSKIIGLKQSSSGEPVSKDDGSGGVPAGCLSQSISRVDRSCGSEFGSEFIETVEIISSRLRTPVVLRDKH